MHEDSLYHIADILVYLLRISVAKVFVISFHKSAKDRMNIYTKPTLNYTIFIQGLVYNYPSIIIPSIIMIDFT